MTTPPLLTSRTLQRMVLPLSADREILPLYVTGPTDAGLGHATAGPSPEQALDRRRLHVPGATTCSFATYFNAFPASYWQRWSSVDEIELAVRLSAAGTVTIWSSDASGERTVVEREHLPGGARSFRLPLTGFDDGGWYWFEVSAGTSGLIVEGAEWLGTTAVGNPAGGVTIGVTTLNRPSYVVDLLSSLSADAAVLEILDQVLVVDQGDQRVREQPAFADVEARLGGRLRVLEQPNLGGSGGFARSMSETLQAGTSRHLLLMDDDVAVEPESVLRASAFADLAAKPMLVGGHMFNLHDRARLHSFGEVVRPERYEWGPADGVEIDHDLAAAGLVESPWMHRRVDVDYTAWWMCLIPVEVLKAVGLSAPFFIAWDDAEFGVRAAAYGFPTVTLPGVAIWHMPFTTKADASDWKTYFEERNRLITALLHAAPGGARGVVGGSAGHQVRALLSMQYAAAELRLAALEDLFDDPSALHATLATRLPEVRALRSRHPDGEITQDLQGFPAIRDEVVGWNSRLARTPGRPAKLLAAAYGAVRQVRPESHGTSPQALLPAAEAVWWRLALLDSALVWSRDGTGVRSYGRDRAVFLRLLRRTVAAQVRLLVQWQRLSRRYRASWSEQTSPEVWRRSLVDAGAVFPDPEVARAAGHGPSGRGQDVTHDGGAA